MLLHNVSRGRACASKGSSPDPCAVINLFFLSSIICVCPGSLAGSHRAAALLHSVGYTIKYVPYIFCMTHIILSTARCVEKSHFSCKMLQLTLPHTFSSPQLSLPSHFLAHFPPLPTLLSPASCSLEIG